MEASKVLLCSRNLVSWVSNLDIVNPHTERCFGNLKNRPAVVQARNERHHFEAVKREIKFRKIFPARFSSFNVQISIFRRISPTSIACIENNWSIVKEQLKFKPSSSLDFGRIILRTKHTCEKGFKLTSFLGNIFILHWASSFFFSSCSLSASSKVYKTLIWLPPIAWF